MRLAQVNGIEVPGTAGGGFMRFHQYATLVQDVVSIFLVYAIGAAGLVFFIRLLIAGFSYMTSLGDPAKLQGASKELTNAAIGFFVVLTSFFIIQIVEVIFNLKGKII